MEVHIGGTEVQGPLRARVRVSDLDDYLPAQDPGRFLAPRRQCQKLICLGEVKSLLKNPMGLLSLSFPGRELV